MSRVQISPPLQSETFLVFPENRFAYTALIPPKGTAPGRDSPPVYLYGVSGVGKSLLIRHYLRIRLREDPESRIAQWTGSEFAARLAEASQNRSLAEFQESCRAKDVFILEDLHTLERRPESQRQFLAIFDELLANHCQLILTSRKPPGELEGFSAKLINRCHGAVLAQIKLPGQASRESLLGHLANSRQIPLAAEVIKLLAESFPVSPRELLGLLTQLENRTRRNSNGIDLEGVQQFLKSEIPLHLKSLADIAKSVARHFNVPLTKLRSRVRIQQFILPRQCAMFLARQLTTERVEQIGRYFGNRDHSTVVHSCNRLQILLEDQPEIGQHLTQIRANLGVE